MAKGEPIYYDKLMLECEEIQEKTLGRGLPPIRFFSNKASDTYKQLQ